MEKVKLGGKIHTFHRESLGHHEEEGVELSYLLSFFYISHGGVQSKAILVGTYLRSHKKSVHRTLGIALHKCPEIL